MNLIELSKALNQLRLGGMAAGLETRILHAKSERLARIDFRSALVSDELARRADRPIEGRIKQARFRDARTLNQFDFEFNRKIPRATVFELATGGSSTGARTCSCSVRPAAARATSRRRSATPCCVRATACSTARRTCRNTAPHALQEAHRRLAPLLDQPNTGSHYLRPCAREIFGAPLLLRSQRLRLP